MSRHYWTSKEDNFLKKHYADTTSLKLACVLQVRVSQVYNRSQVLGLNKSGEFRRSAESGCIQKGEKRGIQSMFRKGNAPVNKGKKMTEYMAPEVIEKIKKTQFKRGSLPHNTLHDGAITVRTDNRGVKEQFIRVGLAKWIPLRRYLWEKANGSIPAGGVVRFRDGNTFNCDINNLELVNRSQNMTMNTIHRYPGEVKEAIRLVGKLKRTINKTSMQNG